MRKSLERSSEEVMRSYIGQRAEQYSFAGQPILLGTLTNIGWIRELYCFAGEGVWRDSLGAVASSGSLLYASA